MVFHEITESAIRAAADDPRDLDIDLVDAQETRRILDRLYGYEVSPVLWKKVAPKLSAGRVQSVATRIIVQRERERMAFRSAGYWDVTAELDASVSDAQASPPKFTAKLNTVDGKRVASGRDFDSLGGLRKPDEVLVLTESAASALAGGLRGAQLSFLFFKHRLADSDGGSGNGSGPATRHSRVAHQGAQNRRLPGVQLRRRVLARPHPRPAAGRRRRAREVQVRAVGAPRRQRRRRLRTALHRQPGEEEHVTELKDLLKDVDELYLATDGDREGEAIAWHLLETLKPRVPVKRMVFHEITEPAIRAAAEDPRDLDIDLVDAQETRRILDRLYGYEVSPVLWKKVAPKLSAGRVQSVATRIIVQRERERMAFRSAGYWDVTAELDASVSDAAGVAAEVHGQAEHRRRHAAWPAGRDFDSLGAVKQARRGAGPRRGGRRRRWPAACGAPSSAVASVEQKPYTRKPYPPFMTSTLQQEAGRKLRFSSERTMSIAQRLYENGYITYMRTDSTTLSETAINAARNQARQLYGEEYVHPTAAPVHPQGEERAGGPRGHPARRATCSRRRASCTPRSTTTSSGSTS